ncbi:hypothetical protein KQX54_017209 [Cotesia glomerata]|uniref:Uncharacterized protein n=1 Tax=Cotesia glomerata TaxID=32391 RepID=A0AAV7J1B5_COTGL|nr:hypothetical protein KQX54_017209 [Cotesia glomerata]
MGVGQELDKHLTSSSHSSELGTKLHLSRVTRIKFAIRVWNSRGSYLERLRGLGCLGFAKLTWSLEGLSQGAHKILVGFYSTAERSVGRLPMEESIYVAPRKTRRGFTADRNLRRPFVLLNPPAPAPDPRNNVLHIPRPFTRITCRVIYLR